MSLPPRFRLALPTRLTRRFALAVAGAVTRTDFFFSGAIAWALGGADVILLPEIPYDVQKIAMAIKRRRRASI